LPGIGQGIAYVAYLTNIALDYADIYFYWVTGEAEGFGTGVSEIHVYPRTLLLDLWIEQIDKAQVFQYPSRGMDTEKNDYRLVDVRNTDSRGVQLTLALAERRFEAFVVYESNKDQLVAFRDRKGHLLQDLEEPLKEEQESWTYGLLADLTDDRRDPRRGVRAILDFESFPRQSGSDPDFYRVNTQLDLYLPVGKQSTFALDWFRSSAVVRDAGETDPNVLIRNVCPVPDPLCEGSPQAQDYVANAIAAHANGTAEALGGRNRLRAYPQGRFQGAYSEYLGAELRLNLTEEVTPFDYLIWKDVRTSIQAVLIAETGTVAETEGDLWNRSRSDYGAGLRMVMASGGVYRVDYVTGDEGPQVTIFVNYPW
jgi:hypothetical protein